MKFNLTFHTATGKLSAKQVMMPDGVHSVVSAHNWFNERTNTRKWFSKRIKFVSVGKTLINLDNIDFIEVEIAGE